MSSLFQSEYFVAVVFTSILGIIALFTYQLGFRKAEPEKNEEESAPKRTKAKQKETKAKKSSETQIVQVAVLNQPEPSKPQKKLPDSPKNAAEAKSAKKQAKKESKKEVEEANVARAEEVVDSSDWTTVVDKRAQKKQKTVERHKREMSDNEVVTIEKPNTEDLNSKQLVIGTKQPSELLTESIIQRTETKDKEDDWVTANQKGKKDKKKEKKEVATVAEVVPQTVPVVPEVKPVEKPKSKKSKPGQNLSSAIREAIVDTLEAKNPKLTLKQTSLTDSIILVEKENKRTESNQSSNESLQDVDGDDGFITITNKKSKRTVRREQ
ncbi:hypothetical protein BpHYR1_047906 [Brachionus plicatilis]|uniref:Uncharacterized protein n=1 Tax=Brachionus plicatilis TaxID=10195 RepID=A0A3M7R029_BRAPC|nr:hypothetical protein BpHYR1_047906 [Brachionus plicatilis]